MALDPFGNYICDLEPAAAPYPVGRCSCTPLEGVVAPDPMLDSLIAYYACELTVGDTQLEDALGNWHLPKVGPGSVLVGAGIIGGAVQVKTTFLDATYTLHYPFGEFLDFTADYCIRLWFYYNETSDAIYDILASYYTRISYVVPDTIRFRSNMRAPGPASIDSGSLTPNSWNRIVVWHRNGVEVGVQINNDAATTLVYADLLAVDPLADPSIVTIAPRNGGGVVDQRIDEIAIWSGYIPNASELLADWNGGAGRTYPW